MDSTPSTARTETGQSVDLNKDTVSEVHCLECGATLPVDVCRCASCGNARFILPERWIPPGESKSGEEPDSEGVTGERITGEEGRGESLRVTRLGSEARVLVGLSLALFCALALLGSARDRTDARISGVEAKKMQVTIEKTSSNVATAGVQDENAVVFNDTDIAALRASASKAEASGAWFEVVDAWTSVTNSPEVTLTDFVSLANAQVRVEDTNAALHTLNRAVVRFPDKPDGYLELGALREKLGDLNAARVQYNVGLSFCPTDTRLASALSRCENALGLTLPEPDYSDLTPIQAMVPSDGSNPGDGWIAGELSGTIPWSSLVHPASNEIKTEVPVKNKPQTLIGTDTVQPAVDSGEKNPPVVQEPVAWVRDVNVNATADKVTINFLTSGTIELSSRSSGNPSRLIIRLPRVKVAEGANFPRNISLNTSLVDRVAVVESSDDNIMTVLLVLYLGENVRWSVGSDAQAIRVNVVKAPADAGGGTE
jgi:hypothetical protein